MLRLVAAHAERGQKRRNHHHHTHTDKRTHTETHTHRHSVGVAVAPRRATRNPLHSSCLHRAHIHIIARMRERLSRGPHSRAANRFTHPCKCRTPRSRNMYTYMLLRQRSAPVRGRLQTENARTRLFAVDINKIEHIETSKAKRRQPTTSSSLPSPWLYYDDCMHRVLFVCDLYTYGQASIVRSQWVRIDAGTRTHTRAHCLSVYK